MMEEMGIPEHMVQVNRSLYHPCAQMHLHLQAQMRHLHLHLHLIPL